MVTSAEYFDKETLVQFRLHTPEFKFNAAVGFAEMYLNDVNVEKEIRTIAVSGFVSKVAEIDEVMHQISGTAAGNGTKA
jgi:cytidylate kinase